MDIIEIVKIIRKKLTDASVPFVSVGRYKENIYIIIRGKTPDQVRNIRLLLSEEENEKVIIEKA